MKKLMLVSVILTWTLPAMAQLLGLPVAGGAAAPDVGKWEMSGGAVVGEDISLYGARMNYSPAKGVALMGDAGVLDLDVEGARIGWCVQGGGMLSLPFDLPVDLGVRATAGYGMSELKGGPGDTRWMNVTAGLVLSKTFGMFTPYALFGGHYMDTEVDPGDSAKVSDDQTDPMAVAGLMVATGEFWSMYGEFAYIDDPFVAIGVRAPF